MKDKKKRELSAFANEVLLNGMKLFEKRFPDSNDKDFATFYFYINQQTKIALDRMFFDMLEDWKLK